MTGLPKKLEQKIEARKANNTLRELPEKIAAIDFSSNDYLGFAKDIQLKKAVDELLRKHTILQNGATGSRLLSGNSKLYQDAEALLNAFHHCEGALIFNSGYDANIGLFSSVPQRNDIIYYDEYIHASIRDGIKLSGAKAFKFKHNDLEHLRFTIKKTKPPGEDQDAQAYLVTESVFSMDGDRPDLAELAAICERQEIRLIVDEAHALGVFGNEGKGVLRLMNLEQKVFARIVTFGKAMGVHGAAILGSAALKLYLVNFARSLIYTTGLPPHSLACIIAGHELLASSEGNKYKAALRENIDYFNLIKEQLGLEKDFIKSDSAIHSCIIEGNKQVVEIARVLNKADIDVRPIRYPSVAKGRERLRFCLHAYNSKQEIYRALKVLKESIVNVNLIAK